MSIEPGGHYINVKGRRFENPLLEADRHKNYTLRKLKNENIAATIDYAVVFPNLTRGNSNN